MENTEGPEANSTRGRASQERGVSFEDRVAELYRLLRYRVTHGRLFGGRQVDLYLEGNFGDASIRRAIECKAGPVDTEDLDRFVIKLGLVRREYPDASGTLITGVSFTDAVASHAAALGIQLTPIRELERTLIDSHGYVTNLLRILESDDTYKLARYVEQSMAVDDPTGENHPSLEVIDQWLNDGDWRLVTVLGDVGTGKSFLSKVTAHRLAEAFLESPVERPFPFLVDLRNADRQFSLEGLIITHASRSGLPQLSFEVFQYLLSQGRIVLILDGFDEMAARVSGQVTARNFAELVRSVQGRAKVMLTCRTHYFKSKTEEQSVVLGTQTAYSSEAAKALYWDLISRKGFSVTYLLPFTISQVEQYVLRARPNDGAAAMHRIKTTYNLLELSQRPMLLNMIVRAMDTLAVNAINAASLYQIFTDAWIHRDRWRDVLSPEAKLGVLLALARALWSSDSPSVHYATLGEYIKSHFAESASDRKTIEEIDHEVRTASFLVRDNDGNYRFAHKSYLEFFLALDCADRLKAGDVLCLAVRRLSPEAIGFLVDLVGDGISDVLEGVVTSDFRPLISENALLVLYRLRSGAISGRSDEKNDRTVLLPDKMCLSGADLREADLSAATFRGADLSRALFGQATLVGADFSGARCDDASFSNADLRLAIAHGASFVRASLSWANLDAADFSDASIQQADLAGAYLGSASIELDEVTLSSERAMSGWSTDIDPRTPDDGFWTAILEVLPRLERAVRRSGRLKWDVEDSARDVVLRLALPSFRARFVAATPAERYQMAWQQMWRQIDRSYRSPRSAPDSTLVIHDDPTDDYLTTDDMLGPVGFDESTTDAFGSVVAGEIRRQLSPEASEVLDLYLAGHSLAEIAQRVGRPIAHVHRLMGAVKDAFKIAMN